jgi:hypothetical protein
MTSFTDLDQLWDNALELPIRGVTYRIEDPSAEIGLYCRRLWETSFEVAAAQKDGSEDQVAAARAAVEKFAALPPPPGIPEGVELWQHLLGAEHDRMVAAGLPPGMIRHAGQTAIAWVAGGDDLAKSYWLSAGRPNAEALSRAARRANQRSSSRSTGAATATRTPVSSSTTSSRQSSRRRGRGRR